jgi:hypothetical protein
VTTSPVSVLALPAVPASATRPSASGAPGAIPLAVDKNSFASLLAKAETDKEPLTNTRSRDSKTKTPDGLASPGQIPIPVEVQLDNRGWNLSLPKDQKAAAAAKRGGGAAAQETTVDEDAAKAHPAETLRQGELAFSVNFVKSAPTGVPPVHGASATQSPTAIPSATSAQHNSSQMGSQGGSQGKSGSKEQHSDSGAHAEQATPAAAHSSNTAAPQASQTPAPPSAANTAAVPEAVSAYSAAQPSGKPAAIQSSAPTTEITEPHHTPSQPQSLDFRVAGTDNRDVTVRVSQRAGDVQMTVRTGDSDLAQSLRQHLPELSDRLAQTGVQADIWRPSAAAGSGANNNADPGHQDDPQAYEGGAGENAAGQRQGNEQQQNAWMNDLFNAEKFSTEKGA